MNNCQHVNRCFIGHGPIGSEKADMSTFKCLDEKCRQYFHIPYREEHLKEPGLSTSGIQLILKERKACSHPIVTGEGVGQYRCNLCHELIQSVAIADYPRELAMKAASVEKDPNPVNHPKHYTSHPSGIECIEVTRHMNFNCGNVVKYLWRAGLKDSAPSVQDLEKARWYLEDEIKRVRNVGKSRD